MDGLKVKTFPIYLAIIYLSDVIEKILKKNKENVSSVREKYEVEYNPVLVFLSKDFPTPFRAESPNLHLNRASLKVRSAWACTDQFSL